ncbi:MAG: Sec-independent protein translocase protein TatB [Woeseia sp.]
MSGVGFWELVLLFAIGLIVLGPERLPKVASQLGNWVGQARRMTRVLRRQLEDELNLEKELNIRPRPPVKSLPQKPAKELDDTYSPAHDAGSPGSGVGAADPGSNNDFADTDVLDEPVKGGAKTTVDVVTPDRNSAAKSNT